MILKRLILAIPLAIGWTIYTAQLNIGNVLLGYIFSYAVIRAIGVRGENFNLKNVPQQVFNTVLYIIFLAYEVFIAGLDVAVLILRLLFKPDTQINAGMFRINTQDETENPIISAISAHGITITPGELVVDFEATEGEGLLMLVHSLNIEKSEPKLDSDQKIRLERIKGMLGYD